MIVGSQIPDFAQGPLAVHTEQGDKGTKLAPTGLQLTPLLQVFVLHTGLLVLTLSLHVAVLHAEASLVHTPEGQSGHRVVQTSCHLGTHILPTGTYITTPCSGRIALLTGKPATSQQEYALVGPY